ncbi:DUF5606 family protein [Adhaeribacter radiodurans]|uniref:DUF5606 domain-containing protein n=1 Tax=Adhaeribacter radiodurans TaxID=2745197 RepID=A0A7L7L565_9BACT|nr:DUF5606 domain-containing protein [Adhaeribacter radiodurans]QMU27951.1 DUF5606 domain-containing protein [Adhaeribacter radiodurans]
MPVNLKDIASIAGMSGLYRIVSPTRNGVIIETLDDKANRQVAQSKHRISLLHEISIYTEDAEVTVPLAEVFERIRQKFGDEITVNSKSSNAELFSFIQEIIPDYDRSRVYVSDIKKIVNWYGIVSKYVPFTEAEPTPETENAMSAEPALSETDEEPSNKES